jgi:hypothetical protein
MQELNLKRMESRVWKAYQQDGLTDVLFGLLLFSAGVIGALDELAVASWIRLALTIALPFSGVGLIFWMRWRFVAPRLGRVRFSARRTRRTRATRVLLGACVLITVILVVLTALSNRLGFRFIGDIGDVGAWAVIAAVILLPVGGLALALDYPRLLVHASLFVTVEFLHVVVHLPSRVPFGGAIAYAAAASISLTIGITVYLRFVRSVPRPEAEEPREGS